MKLDELIKKLQNIREKEGNLTVAVEMREIEDDYYDMNIVGNVEVINYGEKCVIL